MANIANSRGGDSPVKRSGCSSPDRLRMERREEDVHESAAKEGKSSADKQPFSPTEETVAMDDSEIVSGEAAIALEMRYR